MYFTISRGKSPKDDGPLFFDVVPLGGWVVVRYQLIECFEDDFPPPPPQPSVVLCFTPFRFPHDDKIRNDLART